MGLMSAFALSEQARVTSPSIHRTASSSFRNVDALVIPSNARQSYYSYPRFQACPSAKSKPARTSVTSQSAADSATSNTAQGAAPAPPVEPRIAALLGRRQLLAGTAAGLGLFACPCCPQPAQASAWSYGDVGGPSAWKGMCASGTKQSPVDLPLSVSPGVVNPAEFGDLSFEYLNAEQPQVLNTGHGTMQVDMPRGNFMRLGGLEWELLQFHFHAPSEHSFAGNRYAMEAHLVHRNTVTGGLAVLGVLLDRGAKTPNALLQTCLDSALLAPLTRIGAKQNLNCSDLLPETVPKPPPPAAEGKPGAPPPPAPAASAGGAEDHRPFVHYLGSLTTPPCSEGVEWYVFTQPKKVTDAQVLEFMHYVGGRKTYSTNSRPMQYLYDRTLDLQL